MRLSDYIVNNIYKDVDIDFSHIEYIEILSDDIYIKKKSNYKKFLKIGDVISIQYLNIDEIEVKLNNKDILTCTSLYQNIGYYIHWIHIYWRSGISLNLKWYKYRNDLIRENKIKTLLNCN
ncbi:MAG: hypothetical protein M0R46_17730 [Candidatus Muirbacterium halophilum]|nr:hypothetical protein [Candidatus Muirbacterium halophilum]